jgi:hypothetical protein
VLKKEMMFLIGQKGKIPQLFVFKKPIVVKRLNNFGRMNGEIHVFSVILITEGVCVMFKKGLDYTVHDSKIDQILVS